MKILTHLRPGARLARRIAIGAAALIVASTAFAEWTVKKDPFGPGYLVSSSNSNVAPFKAPNQESAQAQANVLNKFEKNQDRKNRKGK